MNNDEIKRQLLFKKDPYKNLREIVLFILTSFFILYSWFYLNTAVYANIYVDGPSMQPTLYTGDILYINKLKKPSRGDIIVINVKSGSAPYIKRVIGLEGDTIKYDSQSNELYIKYSGKSEFVAVKGLYQIDGNIDGWDLVHLPNVITVNKGEVFFLGDNRSNSEDSTENGCRKLTDIIGVVTKWSLKNKKFFTGIYKFLKY